MSGEQISLLRSLNVTPSQENYCEICRTKVATHLCNTCQNYVCRSHIQRHDCIGFSREDLSDRSSSSTVHFNARGCFECDMPGTAKCPRCKTTLCETHSQDHVYQGCKSARFSMQPSRSIHKSYSSANSDMKKRSTIASQSRNEVYCEICQNPASKYCRPCELCFCDIHSSQHLTSPSANGHLLCNFDSSLTESRVSSASTSFAVNEFEEFSILEAENRANLNRIATNLHQVLNKAIQEAVQNQEATFEKARSYLHEQSNYSSVDDLRMIFRFMNLPTLQLKERYEVIEKLMGEVLKTDLEILTTRNEVICCTVPKSTSIRVDYLENMDYFEKDIGLQHPTIVNCWRDNKLYVIGGKTLDNHLNKQVLEYDLNTINDQTEWRPIIIGQLRYERTYFAACTDGTVLHILGGYSKRKSIDEVEHVNIQTKVVLDNIGRLVAPRSKALACYWNDTIYVMGGDRTYIESSKNGNQFIKMKGIFNFQSFKCLFPNRVGSSSTMLFFADNHLYELYSNLTSKVLMEISDVVKQEPIIKGEFLYIICKSYGVLNLTKRRLRNRAS